MSNLIERKENNCLNCNAIVQGRYCHVCGQENVEIKESFFHLVTHFIYDVTHFDSKFFYTLKYLLFRPGFLVTEYMSGRRNTYLNPIKMYVFTSAIFFIIFFKFTDFNGFGKLDADDVRKQKAVQNLHFLDSIYADTKDSAYAISIDKLKNKFYKEIAEIENKEIQEKRKRKKIITDSLVTFEDVKADFEQEKSDTVQNADTVNMMFSQTPNNIKNEIEYRNYQNSLPKSKRDNWIQRKSLEKFFSLKGKGLLESKDFWRIVGDRFIHSFPQMFFISLPFFALLLQILYGRNRSMFYVNHLIFSVYTYITTFVITLTLILVGAANEQYDSSLVGLIQFLLYLSIFYHLYKSLRNVYQETRLKTIIKFFLLNVGSLIFISILSGIFLVLTFFKV
ncbi:MAG: DUF3667 domain-containing protein [Chitinophagaceae bacterium]